MLQHSHVAWFTRTKRGGQPTAATFCGAVLLLLANCNLVTAQTTPNFPLSHKDAWEISIRATEPVMTGGTYLLSTAAIRYGLVLTDPFGKGPLRGTLEYTLDWLPAIVMTKPSVIYGAGVAPFGLKWNLLGKPRLRPYGELVLGGVLSTANLPPGDTININFTVNAGGGLTLLTHGNQALSAGIDFSHLSNGNLGPHNPQLNGIAFVVEYHWLRAK